MADSRNATTRPSDRKKLVNLKRKITNLFEDQGEVFGVEIEAMLSSIAEKPSFPIFILVFAIIKDILDAPLGLSLIFTILTSILSLFLSLILYMWVSSRLSGGVWKRGMIGWMWTRYIAVVLIEFIPLVNIVPAYTIFILMAHNKENKIVQLFNDSLEMIQSAKITFK